MQGGNCWLGDLFIVCTGNVNVCAVDLYLVHSPIPVERRLDTWRAMEEILKSGKAKAIGVSNYGVHHLQELFAHCTIRPSVNQVGH